MNNITLEKDWVAGFIDGDGSFSIENTSGSYRPILSVAQSDVKILHKLKHYFGCGEVSFKKGGSSTSLPAKAGHYRCRSAEHFQKFIIPKLGDNPFQTKNQLKYNLLREEALPLMLLPTAIKIADPNFNQKLEELRQSMQLLTKNTDYVNPNLPITLEWFRGFFEAEGNLYYRCRSKSGRVDIRISLKVTNKNLCLLEKINTFFPFGSVQTERKESGIYKFNIEGIKNVQDASYILRPAFKGDNNIKRCRFLSFLRIVANGDHKTEQGLNKCDKLVSFR